jgi:chromosome segregation ATPase
MKRLAVLGALLLLAAGAPLAQDKKAQDALRRLQATNQRLASDKAQLEREKAKLEEEVAKGRSAERSLKSERGTVAGLRKAIGALEEERDALQADLVEADEHAAELAETLAATEKALAEAQGRGEQLARRLANQQKTTGFWQGEADACRAKNAELGKLGGELLERYRAKTCDEISQQNEPFTGIGRARMENLLEDYGDKLREQKYETKR